LIYLLQIFAIYRYLFLKIVQKQKFQMNRNAIELLLAILLGAILFV